MVNIEFVNLSDRGIKFPHDHVGMVVAQPYLPSDSFTGEEPYQFVPQAKQQQLAVLDETLAVARLSHHCGLKTHSMYGKVRGRPPERESMRAFASQHD